MHGCTFADPWVTYRPALYFTPLSFYASPYLVTQLVTLMFPYLISSSGGIPPTILCFKRCIIISIIKVWPPISLGVQQQRYVTCTLITLDHTKGPGLALNALPMGQPFSIISCLWQLSQERLSVLPLWHWLSLMPSYLQVTSSCPLLSYLCFKAPTLSVTTTNFFIASCDFFLAYDLC